MPDGSAPLCINSAAVVVQYFPDRDVLWLYRMKKRWAMAGIPFPEYVPGTYLYFRQAIDSWFVAISQNSRAIGNLMGGAIDGGASLTTSSLQSPEGNQSAAHILTLDTRAIDLANATSVEDF